MFLLQPPSSLRGDPPPDPSGPLQRERHLVPSLLPGQRNRTSGHWRVSAPAPSCGPKDKEGPGPRGGRESPRPHQPSCCCHPASIPLRFGPPFAPPSSLPPSPPCYFLCTKLVNSYFTFTCKCVNLHLHSKLENCNMILFSITSYK